MYSDYHIWRLPNLTCVSLLVFCFLQHIAEATHIEIFSDASCQNKTDGWNGPNGYPNGRCTSLKREGNFTSFMVTHPDPGCAITIYRKDKTADICSGTSKIGTPSVCYDAQFYYYSIDQCFTPGGSSLPLSSTAAQQTTTIVTTHLHTSHAHTTASSSATATATPHDNGTNVGAIAGGVVGGVAGGAILAAIGIVAFLRYRRTKRARIEGRDRGGSAPPPYGGGAVEIAAKESPRSPGTWGSQGAHELGHEAPVELQTNLVHELPDSGRPEMGSKSPTGTQGSGEAILGRDNKLS